MMRRARRTHRPACKATVARAAIRGEKTMSELAQPFDGHPNQSTQWKEQRLTSVPEVFDGGGKKAAVAESDVTAFHAKSGPRTRANDC